MDVDSFSSYDRQAKLLSMILRYDELCRSAIERGAEPDALFSIPQREAIGRAKSVPADEYAKVYDGILRNMEEEIRDIAGGEEA